MSHFSLTMFARASLLLILLWIPFLSATTYVFYGSFVLGHREKVKEFPHLKMRLRDNSKLWTELFNYENFRVYKEKIDEKIRIMRMRKRELQFLPHCRVPLYRGEFGMEMTVMVPWAHRESQRCLVHTSGLTGSKYLYYFSDTHIVVGGKRSFAPLPKGNPFNYKNTHIPDWSMVDEERWVPPSFADFFEYERLKEMLGTKQLVVIINKYTNEWGTEPKNFLDKDQLEEILTYLTPKYHVVYKRHTAAILADHHGTERDYGEKEMIRERFPSVVLFEDLAFGLDDNPTDENLLLFALMSASRRFLTVQGGNSVLCSYFGGKNIIFVMAGHELWHDDFGYFKKLSNATIIVSQDRKEYVSLVKSHY